MADTAFLCRIWGEDIDHTLTAIVPDWEGVRRFCVEFWTGDDDATDYDGSSTLRNLKAAFDEHEVDERGGAYTENWEIGGISIERICDCSPRLSTNAGEAAPVAKIVSKHGDPEAFGEREIKALADLQKLPYGTKLYAHPPAAVHGQSASTEGADDAHTMALRLKPDEFYAEFFNSDDWRDSPLSAYRAAWFKCIDELRLRGLLATPPAAIPAAPMTDEMERVIDDYLNDYELIGEDDAGREGCYRPTDTERGLIKDAILGLLAHDEWDAAWGRLIARRAALAQPAPVQHNPELLLGWKRYEKLRKLSPAVFTRLHIASTTGTGFFDDLVDALPEPSTPVPEAAPVQQEAASECHGLDTPERVCFYEQDFYVLSNFSSFTLQWCGTRFDTSEAAYHYEKFIGGNTARYDIAQSIIDAPSAHEAFKVAERNKAHRRPDWDDVKVGIMRDILRAKAAQHEYVRRKLLETGERELVENSWRDDFWGWGPNRDGQNMLGRLWMEVRAELRAALQPTQGAKGGATAEAVAWTDAQRSGCTVTTAVELKGAK